MILRTGGGGGFGDPLARDPEHVRRDVGAGYLSSHDAAVRDYGVVLTDDLAIDPDATQQLRDERRCAAPVSHASREAGSA
jgi:N-methylhydantoinase B